MAKAPTSRGFTLAEKRSMTFERVALYAVFFVAIVAAVISFVALQWLGAHLGLGWASVLVPLAIDGFAIACSVGIVRSQAAGEPTRERFSEWAGLFIALGLSVVGNVQHVLDTGSPAIPIWLKIAYASAIPIIVAYGIHVYGRAMSRGISAHVMADDPNLVRFDVQSVGEMRTPAPSKRALAIPREPDRVRTAPSAIESVRAQQGPPVSAPVTPERASEAPALAEVSADGPGERERARALFDEAVRLDSSAKPDAAAIHRAAGATASPATVRRWVGSWWDEIVIESELVRADNESEQEQKLTA